MKTCLGFSLLELLIVMALVVILIASAYPSYAYHLNKSRRNQAEIALLQLAARLEAYYNEENTYKNSTLENLEINQYTDDYQSYELQIAEAGDSGFIIHAIPLGAQNKDKACQTLSLNELGEKSSSGTAKSSFCWE